jgi:hypothetical protein
VEQGLQSQTWVVQVHGLRYRGGLEEGELSWCCGEGSEGIVVWRDSGALMHVRQSLRWRDFNAVLEGALIVQFWKVKLALFSDSGREKLTRQTTIPHLRHSPTISLAQAPNLPLVILGILIPAGP